MPAWHDLPWTLKGDKGDTGEPGPPAPGGSYLTGTVPAGQATVTVSHGLGTRDVVVMVRETTTWQYVPVANDAPTDNAVRLTFAAAPTAGQYRFVIFAALGAPVAPPAAPTAHAATHSSGGTDPVTPGAIGAAESSHTHSGYAASGHTHDYAATGHSHTAADVGAAPASHSHPNLLMGPWTKTSGFSDSELSSWPKRVGGSLTVPALGYDWRPLASARFQIRCDLYDQIPELILSLDDGSDGEVIARGTGHDYAREYWRGIDCSPVFGRVLPGSVSHTFYLVARNIRGGSWIEGNNGGDPHITIYAIPVEAT